MSTLTQFFGGGIKSIQRGTILITADTATATLSPAVDVSKTELRHCGHYWGPIVGAGASSDTRHLAASTANIVLTNTTTITATRGGNTNTGEDTYVSWEITEYN